MNEWDGVIAVESEWTTDKRIIVTDALMWHEPVPTRLMGLGSEYGPPQGKTVEVRRDGKFIRAWGVIDAPPGKYSAAVTVAGEDGAPLRVNTDPDRSTVTVMRGVIREVVLLHPPRPNWPEAEVTVYDGKRPEVGEVSRDDQVRNLLSIMDWQLASGVAIKHYRDDPTVFQCEHGGELHVGWREISDEAMRAQALLDFFDVPGGDPQGRGDLDWRVAEALLELSEARGVLGDIAAAHARKTAGGGMVGDFCVECDYRWPCPTYLRAAGERTSDTPWLPQDDDA